jgi:DNA-binding PadR family transcriptional regulator
MNAEMLRGYTDAIILSILKKGDSYGYMISKKIAEKVNNEIEITNATIYLAFKRMEKENLITSYWSSSEVGARRKNYKITDKGKDYLKDKKKEWKKNKTILDKLLGGR